jgi:hypothetical protein
MTGTRMDDFNTVVGLIFKQTLDSFPVARDIDQEAIVIAMGIGLESGKALADLHLPSGSKYSELLWHTAVWLRDEGYIQSRGKTVLERVVLTSKALAVMNATPAGIGRNLGDKLSDVAQHAASETGRAAIGGIAGEIIGGFAKGVMGAG